MMKFEHIEVHGLTPALRGMRNAHKSHDKARHDLDMKLAETLIERGPSHSKFLRQIVVWVDITAPRYWWSEFDTYKVGVVANSESTMHTLLRDGVTLDDFAIDNEVEQNVVEQSIHAINAIAELWRKDHDNKWIRTAKAILPESFLQKRTVMMSYAALRNMYQQRHDHRLIEWHQFCFWARTLPHSWMVTE